MVEVVNDDTPFKVAVFIFGAIGWLLALTFVSFKDKR